MDHAPATLLAWRRTRGAARAGAARTHADSPSTQKPLAALRQACLSDDAGGARAALLAWAAAAWRREPPRNLSELGERLAEGELVAELAALDRALYARQAPAWRGERLWRKARRGLAVPAPAAAQKRDDLPLLYPR